MSSQRNASGCPRHYRSAALCLVVVPRPNHPLQRNVAATLVWSSVPSYSKFAILRRCHSVDWPDTRSNSISTEKVKEVFPSHRCILMNGGESLPRGGGATSGLKQ